MVELRVGELLSKAGVAEDCAHSVGFYADWRKKSSKVVWKYRRAREKLLLLDQRGKENLKTQFGFSTKSLSATVKENWLRIAPQK